MRNAIVALALVVSASPLLAHAQQGVDKDSSIKVASGGVTAAGWQARLDDKDSKRGMTTSDVKFIAMGNGYHVTAGPAAIYWNPKDVATGMYSASASFTQTRRPTHPEAYGLFVGGANLRDTTQSYLYFLVRGDGKYLINHRAGSQVHKLVDWTPDAAIRVEDAKGVATNALMIHVAADSVHFIANGKMIRAFSKAEMHGMFPQGQAGIRVNHNLDVHVGRFTVKPEH